MWGICLKSTPTFLMAPAFAFWLLAAAGAAPLLLAALCSVLCCATVDSSRADRQINVVFLAQVKKRSLEVSEGCTHVV